MNFFEQQDLAKKASRKLFVLFGIAITLIASSIYLLVRYLAGQYHYMTISPAQLLKDGGKFQRFEWFTVDSFFLTFTITLGIIFFVSWIKKRSLSKGGHSIALMMGAKPVVQNPTNLSERKLLNVVEEIALASGIPVPDVYIIEEPAINAFAAGNSISDAVIGVTRGSIDQLSRQELQGVIAHEFSHVFHGDMRINLKLISLLHGILFLYYIGRFIIRSTTSRSNDKGSGVAMIGIALSIIGYGGYFLGRLIQAAVSRQREFLADASAVQYTRNPAGIAGALLKIGGLKDPRKSKSILQHKKSEEVEHMMFSLSSMPSFLQMMATHPPIKKRILTIDPSIDLQNYNMHQETSIPELATSMGLAQSSSNVSSITNRDLIMQEAGFLGKLDPMIYKACHHPQRAKALMYLLSMDDPTAQWHGAQSIVADMDPYLSQHLISLHAQVGEKYFQHRIELFDLSMPALRRLSKTDFKQFTKTIYAIVEQNNQISLSEWIFVELTRSHLHRYFYPKDQPVIFKRELDLLEDIRILLSSVAYAGESSQTIAQAAFDKGFSSYNQPETSMIEKARLDLRLIAKAFNRVKQAHPTIKARIIESIEHVALSDSAVTWEEYELYRAFADGLGNPLPPMKRKV